MDVTVSRVEWRAKASDAEHVDVVIVVDGMATKLGSVEATPETCAMRSAAAKTTEFICGNNDSFVANVVEGELVVTHGRDEKRIPIAPSIAISVAPYQMPITSP